MDRRNFSSIKWLVVALAMALFITVASIVLIQEYKPAASDRAVEPLRLLARRSDPALAEFLDHSMVLVPAGEFVMGSYAERSDERPERVAYLDAFEIDRYEVTNIQYQRFIRATERIAPPYWNGDNYPNGQADYPVAGVSWGEAEAYCAWTDKRLPTEAEWEKTCRGSDARIYPWGNRWDARGANLALDSRGNQPAGDTGNTPTVWDNAWQLLRSTSVSNQNPGLRPIGSFANGASPFDAMDLVGNVSEWVADWYNWGDYSNMPARNPRGLGPPWNHCVRGSTWYDPVGNVAWVKAMSRCSARSSSHETRDPRVGFRCARSR